MDAKEWNYKGHVAFRMGDMHEAIEAYSESLILNPQSYAIYTKRAEAYIAVKDPILALDDSNQALALKPSYAKAYKTKGEAYLLKKEYDNAIKAYEQGLQVARGDDVLEDGLKIAKKKRDKAAMEDVGAVLSSGMSISSRHLSSSSHHSASNKSLAGSSAHGRTNNVSRRNLNSSAHQKTSRRPSSPGTDTTCCNSSQDSNDGSMSKNYDDDDDCSDEDDAPTVSDFVKTTREDLQQQMAVIQAKLALIELLTKLSKTQKLDLLFGLIDEDRSGMVDAEELAVVLRSRNSQLSTGDSIHRAMNMVAAFDEDGNAALDRQEFERFITSMVSHLKLDFDELAEFLSLELSFPSNSEEDATERGDDNLNSTADHKGGHRKKRSSRRSSTTTTMKKEPSFRRGRAGVSTRIRGHMDRKSSLSKITQEPGEQ